MSEHSQRRPKPIETVRNWKFEANVPLFESMEEKKKTGVIVWAISNAPRTEVLFGITYVAFLLSCQRKQISLTLLKVTNRPRVTRYKLPSTLRLGKTGTTEAVRRRLGGK